MTYATLGEPDHLPEKEKSGYLQLGMIISPFCSVGLLVIALQQLGIGAGGLLGWLKIGFIATGAMLVSYAIFRMAIEKSAPQSTRGYRSSLVTGGFTIFLVGLGFFIATAAGLIIAACEELQLQQHNAAVIKYVDAREARAAQATRLVPVAQTIASDLTSKRDGETASSSVSGRGAGGYGPTARLLEILAGRADGIAAKAAEGLVLRDALLGELDQLAAQMDATLSDEGRSIWDRRRELRTLDGELGRVLNALDEAVPVALIASYADELRAGVSMTNPQVAETINGILRGYASAINAVQNDMGAESVERPAFPAKIGALGTFKYASNFAPVILIAFLVDMVFPLTLWLYTLNGLDWAAFTKNPSRKRTARTRTDLDDLTELQVLEVPKRANGDATPRPSPRTSSTHRKSN